MIHETIWAVDPDLKVLKELSKNTLVDNLGIEITEIGTDYLKATMPVDHRTMQPLGLLHGGASIALAETLGSYASVMCVKDMSTVTMVGLEVSASHVRSVSEGFVTAHCTPIRVGRRMHVWNINVYSEAEKLLSTIRLTVAVLPRQ